MAQSGASTLILATSVVAARQWISELRDTTDLPAEYSGDRKQIRPVTVATYQSCPGPTRARARTPSFAANRQRFLTEQGNAYTILDAHEVVG